MINSRTLVMTIFKENSYKKIARENIDNYFNEEVKKAAAKGDTEICIKLNELANIANPNEYCWVTAKDLEAIATNIAELEGYQVNTNSSSMRVSWEHLIKAIMKP